MAVAGTQMETSSGRCAGSRCSHSSPGNVYKDNDFPIETDHPDSVLTKFP